MIMMFFCFFKMIVKNEQVYLLKGAVKDPKRTANSKKNKFM